MTSLTFIKDQETLMTYYPSWSNLRKKSSVFEMIYNRLDVLDSILRVADLNLNYTNSASRK